MQLQQTNNQGFAPVTLDEAMRFSEMLAKSQMVPKAYQNKPEDVLVAVQWGKELGLAPLQALQNIACINGKPSVYGDAAMALVQASPVCEDIEEYIENGGTENPVAICIAKRKGRKPVTAKFSVEDAKRAGLWGKQGPWSAYPKRMMQMRARGFALRDAFPDVLKGLITAEEAQDYPSAQAKDITPQRSSNPLDALPAPVEIDPAIDNYVAGTWSAAAEEAMQAANIVGAEVFSGPSELVDIEDDIEPEVLAAESTEMAWILAIPGRDPVEYASCAEYIAGYKELVDKVATAGKASATARLGKIKELRVANDATIGRIPAVERIQITAHFAKYQGTLDEKAKTEQLQQSAA